jgi:hypothetical protein
MIVRAGGPIKSQYVLPVIFFILTLWLFSAISYKILHNTYVIFFYQLCLLGGQNAKLLNVYVNY